MKKNIIISTILCLISFSFIYSIDEMPIPPKEEDTRDFTFEKFERQPVLPKYLEEGIRRLKQTKANNWNGSDSLFFAYRLTLQYDFEHALSYFVHLNTDSIQEKYSLHLLQLCYRETARFQRLIDLIEKEYSQAYYDPKVYEFRKRIAEVRLFIRDRNEDPYEMTIFSELLTDSLKNKSRYEYVKTANSLDKALRVEVLFMDESDKVISKAYEEFGDYLHEHFYLSNAFIAYSIARHFSKHSNSAQKKMKEIKEELKENNYLLPSFIRTFPKIKDDRYSFAKITPPDSIDLVIYESGNFLSHDDIVAMQNERKDYLPWLDYEVLVIAVLILSLIAVLLGVKSRKS